MKRKKILFIYTIVLAIIFFCNLTPLVFAADPTLVTTLTGAFTKLKGYIVKIATSFVAVAIATRITNEKIQLRRREKNLSSK